ncbi:MAG TPA: fibronectin type III domain-containing protein [Candidatus Polarisedimenticolia bacterium]|nr:fibronectin type III domain-containing protein [Candidatus Polarisedimenticolia bacterium]
MIGGKLAAMLSWLFVAVWATLPASAASLVRLAWDANSESDLAGYRLHYGTSPGVYNQTQEAGTATSLELWSLDPSTTYYFVVHAFDRAGNESPASNAVSARPVVVVGPAPIVSSAVEVATHSHYILQSGRHTVRVSGSNFQDGALMNLGPGIVPGATSLADPTELTATIDVASTATLGPRTLVVTNPDSVSGSRLDALAVVKTADIVRDCLIDGSDLNILARAWNTRSGEVGYVAESDLDGDDYVGPVDLTIFGEYFGQRLTVCP